MNKIAKDVYETLCGQYIPEYAVKWVEETIQLGDAYGCRYAEMLRAYERLRERLGVINEDRDVEIIINALLRNQEDVAEKMFLLGIKYAEEIKPRR